MCIFKSVFSFLQIKTRSGIARSYESSILNFLMNLHTVFIVAVPIYIPTNSVLEFHFLHILTNTLFFVFLTVIILTAHCGFDLHSPLISDVEHLSKGLLAICVSSFLLHSYTLTMNYSKEKSRKQFHLQFNEKE